MLPSSLEKELGYSTGKRVLNSLDPVVENQRLSSSSYLPSFKRTPARNDAAQKTTARQEAAPGGQENNGYDTYRRASLPVARPPSRTPLTERSNNLVFCSKPASKLLSSAQDPVPAAPVSTLNNTRRLERRLAFEELKPAVVCQAASGTSFHQNAQEYNPDHVNLSKSFAQVTKMHADPAFLSNHAAPARLLHPGLDVGTDTEAIAAALLNTDFSLWSNSRLTPTNSGTGPMPLPIAHHAPPSQNGISFYEETDAELPEDTLADPEAFATFCHVQSSRHCQPASVQPGIVKSLIEQQVQSGQPYRAPWYRHRPRNLSGRSSPAQHQSEAQYQVASFFKCS